MHRLGFKMKLHAGKAEEYKRRHDELWPELGQFLKDSTVSDYSIFLDKETNILFGTLKVEEKLPYIGLYQLQLVVILFGCITRNLLTKLWYL